MFLALLCWAGIGFIMGTAYIVVYVYGSEILPTTVRSYGIGVATFLAKGGAVCGLYTASVLVSKIQKWLKMQRNDWLV